jgi:hypothetical protein
LTLFDFDDLDKKGKPIVADSENVDEAELFLPWEVTKALAS